MLPRCFIPTLIVPTPPLARKRCMKLRCDLNSELITKWRAEGILCRVSLGLKGKIESDPDWKEQRGSKTNTTIPATIQLTERAERMCVCVWVRAREMERWTESIKRGLCFFDGFLTLLLLLFFFCVTTMFGCVLVVAVSFRPFHACSFAQYEIIKSVGNRINVKHPAGVSVDMISQTGV